MCTAWVGTLYIYIINLIIRDSDTGIHSIQCNTSNWSNLLLPPPNPHKISMCVEIILWHNIYVSTIYCIAYIQFIAKLAARRYRNACCSPSSQRLRVPPLTCNLSKKSQQYVLRSWAAIHAMWSLTCSSFDILTMLEDQTIGWYGCWGRKIETRDANKTPWVGWP